MRGDSPPANERTAPGVFRYSYRVTMSRRQFDSLYRAFQRSDTSLDGRAFVAVRTTGIYCLLSCRARKPKRENIDFYLSRQEAERHGFRPCRRCRPEAGGRAALERQALAQWLVQLTGDESRVDAVAHEAGVNPSRLYRTFRRHLGRGPRDARARARLFRACELLRDPRRSITEAAYDSGFGSLASFYRWFRREVGITPAAFRDFCSSNSSKENEMKEANACAILETPLGRLRVEASSRGLCKIYLGAQGGAPSKGGSREAQQHLQNGLRQLREYFAGKRNEFDVPLDLEGTRHQQRVWRALLGIPFGRTLTYGQVAHQLGIPRSARAVGRACATNPVPVVVPCHRVLGGDGALHGFGGGLWRKRALLEHEGVLTPELASRAS